MTRVIGSSRVTRSVTRKRLREENLEEKTHHDPILYDKLNPPTYVTAPGRRIVVIGDVHGDLKRTEAALQLAGVLGSNGLARWVGGSTVLVQLGDILDRGQDEIAILSLLHNLSEQARCAGGAVLLINGNHETMNVEGDFRCVDPGGFEEAASFREYCEEVHHGDYDTALSGWYLVSKKKKASQLGRSIVRSISCVRDCKRKGAAAREFLYSPGGPIARKLSQHGVVLKVNDWLFAHGGVLPLHVEYGLEKINEEITQWMRRGKLQGGDLQSQPPIMVCKGSECIVWSRLYSEGEFKASAVLKATLKAAGAKALVVGHTIQANGANSECQGKVWRIDVGMSSGVLNAQPEVLEIIGNHARVLSARKMEEK